MEVLKATIREQEYADDFLDAHNAASLMKLWLSSLPQSLIPDTLTYASLHPLPAAGVGQ